MAEPGKVIELGCNFGEVTGTVSWSLSLELVKASRKPPWYKRVKDRNLEAAKFLSKEAAREAIVEAVKWLFGFRLSSPFPLLSLSRG